jgi:hypothetical protein
MNNTTTRTLALVAVFIATILVVGTFATVATTQSVFAIAKKPPGRADKKTRDNGSGNGNGNTVTIEECKNKGSASGFDTATNQECENLICTHPGENATCTQEGAVSAAQTPVTPVKLTCEQCFTKFLNAEQISEFTLPAACAELSLFTTEGFQAVLLKIGVSSSVSIQLIQCLIDAGVQFRTT